MSYEERLFIHKYQPVYFTDFEIDDDIIKILKIKFLYTNFVCVGTNF